MKWVALLLVITVLDGFLGIVCKVEVPSHASTLNIWPNRIGWFSMVQKGEATKTVYTSIYTGLASLSYNAFVRVCVCVSILQRSFIVQVHMFFLKYTKSQAS